MASEWLHRRYERYLEQSERQRLRGHHQANAIAKFNSMFQAIQTRVAQDVTEYNGLFGQRASDQSCRASFETILRGFQVSVADRAVSVTWMDNSTVIRLQFKGVATGFQASDHIEVEADDQGRVVLYHSGRLVETDGASEIILDPVLCGGEVRP